MQTPNRLNNNALVAVLLLLVMTVGAYYRFVGLNWDDFTHLHPDERFLTQVLSGLGGDLNLGTDTAASERFQECLARYPNSNGRGLYLNGGYFDAQCSALNPNNVGFGLYVYGTLPLFIADITSDRFADTLYIANRWNAERSGDPIPPAWEFDTWRGYNGAHIVWRALNGIADLLVVWFMFLIGRRLHGKWVGLLAAALYVAAPLPIQKAHFATVNTMANLFAVVSLYYAVRVQDEGRWSDYFGFGVAFAASLASRINLVPLVILILLASGLRMLPAFDWKLAWGERNRIIGREFGGLVLAGIVTIVGFRIFQPYAFQGPGILSINFSALAAADHTLGIFNERWLDNMGQAQYLVSGAAESPPNWQWINRTGYVFPFTNMVLWGMGVALGLSAWLGWLWSGVQLVRGQQHSARHLLLFAWILIYFAWIGNLWVMSMRYYLPLYPGLILLGAWGLVALWQRSQEHQFNSSPSLIRWLPAALILVVIGFTQLWGLMFTNIYRNQLTRVQATHWVWENVPGDFSMQVEEAPEGTPRINIAIFNRGGTDGELDTQATVLEQGLDYTFDFLAPADGVIRSVQIPHLGHVNDGADSNLRVRILTDQGAGPLAEGVISGSFPRDRHVIGDPYTIELDTPLRVSAGERYNFLANVEAGSSLLISGAIVSHEGAWDDPIPTVVCTLPDGITLADNPPPGLNNARNCNARNAYAGLVNGYGLAMALDDVLQKRDNLKLALDNTDYIVISSNRFYDTLSRNPQRWTMSNVYYEALFNGSLGFDLAHTFQETFEFGPFRVSDQHLPTMASPAWLNEFEAEEAFHVYDHPVVFIFAKNETYTSANTARILDSVELTRPQQVIVGSFNDPNLIGPNPIDSLAADVTPTQLKLRDDARERQYNGGTWAERFISDSVINTQPVLSVIGWWLLITLIGMIAFPMVFTLFPMLADRGFGFTRFIGLFVVSWGAWFATSLNLPLWSMNGLWAVLVALMLVSVYFGWIQRHAFSEYLRENKWILLRIELVTLAAFLFFLGVRISNPDLWHPAFGGEKPMDFAYFNAVLRSTTFPPLDPWHAGGFINYYYFGFVLVGAPVLMLGMLPSIGYNLAIPLLFALTGMGAFSIAFNVVRALENQSSGSMSHRQHWLHVPRGNAWVAGIAALLLSVVLGNLNTPRVFVNGVVNLGDYTPYRDVTDFLYQAYVDEHGIDPPQSDMLMIVERGNDPSWVDQTRFQMANAGRAWTSFGSGLRSMSAGVPLPIPTNRWYWASTRVLAEPPVSSGNAITEMPYFTFLYGDLHAHMISMPMQLFVMLFVLHEIIHAGHMQRRVLPSILAIALGALTVGMIRATNTWDWPTYLLLGILGLGYAWWLKWRVVNRASIVDVLLRIGGFIALSVWLSLPYTRWYAAIYSSASLWQGPKTPLWAYLIIHGLFVFLVISLLLWETNRWLQSVYVHQLRGRLTGLYAGLMALAFVLFLSIGLYILGWWVSLILIPILIWAAILFFRPNQTRPMQFALALIALAVGVTLGVEYIVIDGDIGRQNTVFKFYLQGWLMYSVVGGVIIAWLLEHTADWNIALRGVWTTVLSVLIAISALYPIMATQARAVDRMAPEIGLTIDGMDYMSSTTHYEVTNSAAGEGEVLDLSHDYHLIRWLQENVEGTPIIMEGQSEAEYRWGSRISIYTGLPSIVGWNWHQRQQRTFDPMPLMVQQRVANVNAFYTTTDLRVAADILQHYDVSYVIVSVLERARYPQPGIDKLNQLVDEGVLEVVYEDESGIAVVFQVNRIEAQLLALGLDDPDAVVQAN